MTLCSCVVGATISRPLPYNIIILLQPDAYPSGAYPIGHRQAISRPYSLTDYPTVVRLKTKHGALVPVLLHTVFLLFLFIQFFDLAWVVGENHPVFDF